QGGDALGDRGDGGGHHHHAGHLRLRAPGRGPARQGAGAVPGDRAPAPFRGAHEGVRDRATRGAVRGRGSTLYDCRGAMVSPPASTWIIAGLVFLAVTLGAIALALLWEWTRELLARRAVRRQLERAVKGETAPGGTPDALFRAALADVQWVRLIAAHVPQLRDLERLLQQAGMRWS